MKKIANKKLFYFRLFLFFFIFSARFTAAQSVTDSGGFSISPAYQQIEIDSAEKGKEFEIKIKNNTGTVQKIVLKASDFSGSNDLGGVSFSNDESSDYTKNYGLAKWIRLEKNELSLEPGVEEKIKFFIENTDSLSPGGHYGAILFEAGGEAGEDTSTENISLRQSIASLIFLKKIGGEKYLLTLEDSVIDKKTFFFPEKVELKFKNDGNTHIVPRGIVSVKSPLGRIVAKGIINRESAIILPGITRSIRSELKNDSKFLLPGNYSVETSYRFDGKDDFVYEKDRFFYAGSIWFWLPTFLTIIILSAIIWRYRKKRKSNKNIK